MFSLLTLDIHFSIEGVTQAAVVCSKLEKDIPKKYEKSVETTLDFTYCSGVSINDYDEVNIDLLFLEINHIENKIISFTSLLFFKVFALLRFPLFCPFNLLFKSQQIFRFREIFIDILLFRGKITAKIDRKFKIQS